MPVQSSGSFNMPKESEITMEVAQNQNMAHGSASVLSLSSLYTNLQPNFPDLETVKSPHVKLRTAAVGHHPTHENARVDSYSKHAEWKLL